MVIVVCQMIVFGIVLAMAAHDFRLSRAFPMEASTRAMLGLLRWWPFDKRRKIVMGE